MKRESIQVSPEVKAELFDIKETISARSASETLEYLQKMFKKEPIEVDPIVKEALVSLQYELGLDNLSMVIHYLLQMQEDMKSKTTIKQHEVYKSNSIHMHFQISF
ncbi:hypothetical protein RB298_05030 [Priestia sp. BR_2]